MEIIPFQTCRSNEGWFPVVTPSESSEGVFYTVMVNPWTPQESVCECKAYLYRGTCKHQFKAAERVCNWSEFTGEQQTLGERQSKICPACGGPTRWDLEVIEEDE